MNKRLAGFFGSAGETIISFDKFPQPVLVNYNRKTEIKSVSGILMTALVYGVMIAYLLRMG